MRTLRQLFFFCLLTALIIMAHTAVQQFLPFPLNQINVIFLVMAWLVMASRNSAVLWVMLLPSVLVELFSTLPFGISGIALFLGIGVVRWLGEHVFTNHLVYRVVLSGCIGLVCYNFFVVLALLFVGSRLGYPLVLSAATLRDMALQTALTTTGLSAAYLIAAAASKRLKPQYISWRSTY